jgi:choline dehydrogenase-like flavoprotein
LTLVNHHVAQLLWSSDDSKFAHGVRFKQSNNTGSEYEAYARKEVILAAGAINTPALLQRSGVGDPTHLSSLGIETVIDLPTVGKNLQEQTNNQLGAGGTGFDTGGKGPADVIAFPNLYELFGADGDATATKILNSLDEWAETQKESALSKEALKAIYAVQADQIVNKNGSYITLYNLSQH